MCLKKAHVCQPQRTRRVGMPAECLEVATEIYAGSGAARERVVFPQLVCTADVQAACVSMDEFTVKASMCLAAENSV